MFEKHLIEALPFPKPSLYLFNTESRKKERFKPLKNNHATMYTCGPTVYHFAHIGNFRTYIFEDLLKRTLKFFGLEVSHVMNITDVDDKTIRGASESNQTLSEYIQPYKNAFFVDIQTLGIERADNYPCATDFIPHMIDFIQKLINKGIAYHSHDGSVYFSIEKCPRYGRLSHLKLDDLKVGEEISSDEYEKESIGDFVLWKGYDPKRDGAIFWESPFGKGRPGWHLECSTMAMHLLGDQIDLHMGAVDNIFPHHENEIAQSEMLSGCCFCNYWVHSEHLIVNGKKMSKSLGNFFTLRDLLKKGFEGPVVRYMLMHTHYRTQLNFTFEGLESAKISLGRINDFIIRIQELAEPSPSTESAREPLKKAIEYFTSSLADDLNISSALAAIFDLMHEINALYDAGALKGGDALEVLYVMHAFNRVLGLFSFEKEEAPRYLQEMLEKREEARKNKQWAEADRLRDEILASGYLIEDTNRGTRLKKK